MQIVADNIHGLNPVVVDAMDRLDPSGVKELALRCEEAGADLIDINPGHLSRSKEDRMRFLVDAVQEAVSLPLVLDSPNPRLLEVGLSACNGTPILNGISMEQRKLEETLPLAVEHGTPLVALLMDERSFTPPQMEEKLVLALQLREIAMEAGLLGEDLIFDPVLPNLSWDDAWARAAEAVRTVRLLSSGAVLQEPARTMSGLSNLRSGMRGHVPFSVEETCLAMLAGAGLELILVDVLQPGFEEAKERIARMA